jgi:hypothetical protein
MLAHQNKNDIRKALDKAAGGADSNPVTRKLRGTLPGSGPKYSGSQADAPQVITKLMHIEDCIRAVAPGFAEAFKGKISCAADGDQRIQEFNAMVETAQQLYEKYTQSGVPSMTMMARISKEMSGMNFHVSKEAAVFATEAHIHQMCTVGNLVKTCCFEGAAYTLVTDLGPERFTEWKAALINQTTGKMPQLFSMLEICVRSGKLEPHQGSLEYEYPTPGHDIMRLLEEMVKLRKVLKDLRRAELVAAKEHDRIREAARKGAGDGTSAQRPPTSETHTAGAPTGRGTRVAKLWTTQNTTRPPTR